MKLTEQKVAEIAARAGVTVAQCRRAFETVEAFKEAKRARRRAAKAMTLQPPSRLRKSQAWDDPAMTPDIEA